MSKRSILHMFDPMPNNSPFDINMALDAGFDVLMPYSNVKLESIQNLTQDAIFSRSPSGIKKTALFIGGRDIGLAIDMLEATKPAMVPPFEVSVFADPSGAYTTAAALVACVEKALLQVHGWLRVLGRLFTQAVFHEGLALIALLAGGFLVTSGHLVLLLGRGMSCCNGKRKQHGHLGQDCSHLVLPLGCAVSDMIFSAASPHLPATIPIL
jgi:hypothetical protein